MADQIYSHAHERSGRRCEIIIKWSAPDEAPELWWDNGCFEAEKLLADTWQRTIEIVAVLNGDKNSVGRRRKITAEMEPTD